MCVYNNFMNFKPLLTCRYFKISYLLLKIALHFPGLYNPLSMEAYHKMCPKRKNNVFVGRISMKST